MIGTELWEVNADRHACGSGAVTMESKPLILTFLGRSGGM